jgi:hypothetical protein
MERGQRAGGVQQRRRSEGPRSANRQTSIMSRVWQATAADSGPGEN